MTGLLSMLLKGGRAIGALPIAGRWLEVDSADDLDRYAERLAADEPWSHDWRRPPDDG